MSIFDLFFKKKNKRPLTSEEQKWNSMWDLWAKGNIPSPYAEIMDYEGEVNNGGHVQFFDNTSNIGKLDSHMDALYSSLPEILKDNLEKAYSAYLISENNEESESVDEILNECDNFFYENENLIIGILKKYANDL